MIQYLVILLDDTSVSYCHADNPHTEPRLMPLDTLRKGILYAMKQNLMIQFVYPDRDLPKEYLDLIDTIDHHDIVPWPRKGDVITSPPAPLQGERGMDSNSVYVLRFSKEQLFASEALVADLIRKVQRLNVAITDVETFTDADLKAYTEWLDRVAETIKEEYLEGRTPQLNLITDRMMLTSANHCNAGVENITLAPDGRFYLCPAFYLTPTPRGEGSGMQAIHAADGSVGSLAEGLAIPNAQLLRLDHAPLCRHCDAFHCRRCVWLNKRITLELNTPSHEQCAVAHTERETSRRLLAALRQHGTFMPEVEIPRLDYTDPFDVRKEW